MAKRRSTSPAESVRQLVYERDGGRCVRCNSVHRLTIHHRVNRGMGCAQIIGVMVSESLSQDAPGAIMPPWRKRDEMWLATRSLLQPDPSSGRGRLRLHIDKKAAAQLSTPKLLSTTSGYTQIESKKAMKARGIKSPDRAEAVLLALYEPEPLYKPRNRGLLN